MIKIVYLLRTGSRAGADPHSHQHGELSTLILDGSAIRSIVRAGRILIVAHFQKYPGWRRVEMHDQGASFIVSTRGRLFPPDTSQRIGNVVGIEAHATALVRVIAR